MFRLIVIQVRAVDGVAADLHQALRLILVWIVDEDEFCHVKGNHHVAAEGGNVSSDDCEELLE